MARVCLRPHLICLLLQEAAGKISEQLMQRLRLKPEKIKQLGAGLRSIAAQDEPIGKTLSRMEIAQGLELEKVGFFLSFFLLFLFRQSDLAIPMSLLHNRLLWGFTGLFQKLPLVLLLITSCISSLCRLSLQINFCLFLHKRCCTVCSCRQSCWRHV